MFAAHCMTSLATRSLETLPALLRRWITASPTIAKVYKPGKVKAEPLRGLFSLAPSGGEGRGEGAKAKEIIVEYEPDPDLRDTEQIPFLEAPPSGDPCGLPSEASAKEGI